MRVDRRFFLRLLAGTLALVPGRRSRAQPGPRSWDVHRATRNTWLGASGTLLSRLRSKPLSYKPYPGSRRIPLPASAAGPSRSLTDCVRSYGRSQRPAAGKLGLPGLARLLALTNGITAPAGPDRRAIALRAAPSAGALYSGEVYVVAGRIDGLAPGVYSYDVARNELVVVRVGALLGEVARAVAEPDHAQRAAAAILLTNVFERYTWRYANRGYRYALIDSGHIGENLRLAAASAGLAEASLLSFHDDRLNALLGVDGLKEAVCAVHLVGAAAPEIAESAEIAERAESGTDSVHWVEKQRTALAPSTEASVIRRYHDSTRLVAEAAKSEAPRPARSISHGAADVALPRPGPGPQTSVEAAIRIRRSARRFRAEPIALADLGYLLEMAKHNPLASRTSGIDLYLVVHRVSDLAPGLYRYAAKTHRLATVRAGNLSDALVQVCLGQQKAGSAAVGFLMVAQLGEDGTHARTRHYRDLLVEAGAIGQRLYLAAEAAGLAARNLAAFLDDDLNRLLGLDGRRQAVVHLTMAGPGN